MTILGIIWAIRTLGPMVEELNVVALQAPTPETIAVLMQFYGGMFLLQLLGVVAFWLYYALMESSSRQATLGKMVMGLKVVGEQGQRITFWHATGRTFAKIVSAMTIYIGFLIAGATRRKQALHDMIASTFVVDKSYQKGDALPEVPTHYVLLGVSIAAVVFVFFVLPFMMMAWVVGEMMNMPPNALDDETFTSEQWDQEAAPVMRKLQDLRALSKLPDLQELPKEQQNPFTEEDYAFSFEDDGTVRAQHTGDASFAFIMRPDAAWPCCQPLVPEGCDDVTGVHVCQAK